MKVSDAIARYVALRDAKDVRKKEQQEELRRDYLDEMEKIEALFLKLFEKSGQTNAKVKGIGTAFVAERVSDTVTDRNAFFAFVQEHEAFDFVANKVNKSAVDEYVERHHDLPPGINRKIDRTVNIRRG